MSMISEGMNPDDKPTIIVRHVDSVPVTVMVEDGLTTNSPISVELQGSKAESLRKGELSVRDLVKVIEAKREEIGQYGVKTFDPLSSEFESVSLVDKIKPSHVKDNLIKMIVPPNFRTVDSAVPSEAVSTVEDLSRKLDHLSALVRLLVENSASTLPDEALKLAADILIPPQLQAQPSASTIMPSLSNFSIAKQPSRSDHLDFAFLYSNPLVTKENGSALAEPVNFSAECNDIINTIDSTQKSYNVHIECATQKDFIKILKRKPRVLHIMCHGQQPIKDESNEYFLEFEGDNGEQSMLTVGELREKLKHHFGRSLLEDVKVAYINACHSEVDDHD